MLSPPYDPAPLVALYRAASAPVRRAGMAWYRTESARILSLVISASGYRLTRARAAGIVALLSPRCSWRQNIRRAIDVGARIGRGDDPGAGPGIFRRVRPLLRHVARCDTDPTLAFPATALKTAAFFRNLTGDLSPVTVDIWAARAVGAESADLSNPVTYQSVADAYRAASVTLGDAPASVQAVIWCAVRGAPGTLTIQRPLLGFGLPPFGIA